jgi:molecular chaperone DnaJ
VDIRTLDGIVSMKVPPGTQPDTKLAMRNKGVVTIGSSRRGDQIVTLKVFIPRILMLIYAMTSSLVVDL